MKNDLTNTKPNWILSAYGPGKDTPATLLTENEFSPEELRFRFYQQRDAGPGQAEEADKEAIRLWTKAANDMTTVANNVDDVQKFMEQKEKEHPNRYDFCKMDGKTTREEFEKNSQMNSQPGSSMNPFGGATRATTTTNPFSKPAFGQSAFQVGSSQSTSPFGQPAPASSFGKPAFASPSFGQSSTPAFGAPTTNSAFGKPLGSTSGFGQAGFGQTAQPAASGFGQQAQGSSAFGQTSNPGQGNANAFAKPTAASGFGAVSSAPSAFGQPAFGQPAGSGFGTAGTGTSAFGQSGFGKPAAPGTSPFGQPASQPAFGQTGFGQGQQQNQQQSGFGTGASPGFSQQNQQSGFGQTSQPQQNTAQTGFGTGFGQPTNSPSFGQPQSNQTPANPFSKSPFGQSNNQQASPFGQPQATSANPFSKTASPQPSTTTQSTFGQPQPVAPQPQSSVAQPTTSTTKPTTAPIQPLHYTQTLPAAPTTFTPAGDLTTYRSRPISYRRIEEPTMSGEMRLKETIPRYQRPDNGNLERIWFPRGSDEKGVQTLMNVINDVQAEEAEYTDEVKKMYGYLFERGRFEARKVPLIPPLQSWVDRDF